ncbi:MAG: FAD-dependent oxidoreductase [Clostridiales bacterium]|jgi:NAD(P)H-nitrite reductase large subunit|nr:FAD-dependent oxidoreductase [Clostridiales bacterium]
MRLVIIGNSAAGIGAVEGIRQTGSQDEIVIISGEPYHTYSRPLISYLLLGRTTEERMRYRPEDFYTKNRCELIFGTAAKVEPESKRLTLSDGRVVPYDKLLAAAGSVPFVPSFAGLGGVRKKFTFMSLEDARALEAALGPTSRVLVIGAGLIGLKCAEGIFHRAARMTVVDLAPNILSSILDAEGSEIVQGHLEDIGIVFRLGRSVASFEGYRAVLDSGESLEFDVLVLAVGVRPNTGLFKGIVKIDRGIVVNSRMETSRADIYAAGDCAQGTDVSSGQSKVIALLPNAYMQGECAGVNMAGGSAVFDKAMPMNAIGFFGLHIITAGNYNGEVYCEREGRNYKKLFYGQDRLNGYILIGDVEKAGIYTGLIRERTPLSTIDFGMICKRPGLMAFAREDRKVKLGRPSEVVETGDMGVY